MYKALYLLLLLSAIGLEAQIESKILDSQELMVINPDGTAEYTVYTKMYVADEQGKDLAHLSIFLNDYMSLKSAEATLLDKKGKKKKKYKKRHLVQVETSGSGILASSGSYQTLDFSKDQPLPFTVEMKYTVKISSLFFWPDWTPQASIPVEKATLNLQMPPSFGFAHFSPNGISPEELSPTRYAWQLSDLEPYPDEERVPPEVNNKYRVFFTADSFSMGKYQGSNRSWRSIGEFYANLASDQYGLDDMSATDLKFQDASTLKDSIAQVYEYLQSTTRYVGIELGIHGWRPHSSQWVCDNKYGDCKDLATYFISLLSRYDIKAYPVLIRTRSSGYIYPEFPNDMFNHVIACVPTPHDTLWVDCTVDDGRIDILPANDQGCNVLFVDGSNSRLMRTPIYEPDVNVYGIEAHIKLSTDGSAELQATLAYEGLAATNYRSSFQRKTLKKQREYVIYLFNGSAPGLTLDTFSIRNLNDKYLPLEIYLEGQVPHMASTTGDRLFLPLGIPYKAWFAGDHPGRRKNDYFSGTPSLSRKEITVEADPQLHIEGLPAETTLETPFGNVVQSFNVEDNIVHYSWSNTHTSRIIPVDEYADYYDFRTKLNSANKSPIVFKKR